MIMRIGVSQVCKAWKDVFDSTKKEWTAFCITRPISDCACLRNILSGAAKITRLQLMFDSANPPAHPEQVSAILESQTSLVSLALINPGTCFQHAVASLPRDLCDLHLESISDLETTFAEAIATRLTQLKSVHVADAPGFTDEALNALVTSTTENRLECISISSCRSIRGACMHSIARNCKHLQSIKIARCRVLTVLLEPIAELATLKEISLVSCGRTDSAPSVELVRQAGGKLRSLVLFDTGPLYNEGLNKIALAQPMLTRLVLGACNAVTEDAFSAAIATLPHLTHLSMSGCNLLSDGALSSIASHLPSLRHLLLTECSNISDAGLFAMEQCTNLTHLTLHPMENVTCAGLKTLCDYCDSLEYLCLVKCPAATASTITSMLACCLNIKVKNRFGACGYVCIRESCGHVLLPDCMAKNMYCVCIENMHVEERYWHTIFEIKWCVCACVCCEYVYVCVYIYIHIFVHVTM